MKRVWIAMVILAACVGLYGLTGCANKSAQTTADTSGRGGGVQQGGGGGQMAQFRDEHKYTFMLMRMAEHIANMEKEQQTPLTQAQAATILQVLTPLRSKTSLSQDEAKATIRQLKPILTERQLTEIGKMKSSRQSGSGGATAGAGQDSGNAAGGQRQGGQGRGGTGSGGQRPRMDPAQMKDFNPFNPPPGSPMAARAAHWQEFFDGLAQKAHGGAVAPAAPATAGTPGAHHGHGHHHAGDAGVSSAP